MKATVFSASLGLVALAAATHANDTGDSTAPDPLAAPAAPEGDFRVYWKEGLRFDTPDKEFRLKLGGRIMIDWGWFAGDDLEDATGVSMDDGTEIRRARLFMEGEIYGNTKFKAEYDFAGQDADFKDVYLEFKDLPLGSWRVGHFKEPMGLEQLTSSRFITFMERSTASDSFTPERNSGIQVANTAADDNLTWALGLFRDTNDAGFDRGEGGAITGRVTYTPQYADDGAKLVHLGISASHRDADDNASEFGSHPEAHLIDDILTTGSFPSDSENRVGLEAAWVRDAFSLQGEYFMAMVDSTPGDDPDFNGFYAQASWFVTGEHRPYKRSAGAFDRVSPKENWGKNGGNGAIELAARYSSTDLEDGAITGEKEDNISLGANWYMNPNTRLMANLIRADFDNADENASFFMIRFQVDF